MDVFAKSDGIIAQRDISLYGFEELLEGYAGLGEKFDPNAPALALSFRGELYELNAVGAFMWESFEQTASAGDLEQLLQNTFGVDELQARSDVHDFLENLRRWGLITHKGTESAASA